MEKLKHWMKNRYFWLLVAAGMPLFISAIICIGNGVYPFGENCLLHVDMYHQYCPFFTEFLRKLREGKSLMYSWNIGLGSDFVSVFASYLASPLNWLLIFCPKGHVIEFMSILMIGKISLAGAACYWYLQEHFSLREEKDVYFKQAEAFVLPSFNEAFPLVNIEAMEYKLPIVSTNVGGIPDEVVDGKNGYIIKDKDSQSLADSLCKLLGDESLRQKMGENGFQKFKAKFTEKCFENKIKDIFIDCIADNKR